SGALTAQNCFVVETPGCSVTPNTPLSQAQNACLRGQIGESLIASESARQRVQRAIVGWNSTRSVRDAWFEHCAQKQDFEKKTKEMIDAVAADEIEENEEANAIGILGGVMGVLAGAATDNPVAAFGGMATLQKSLMGIGDSVQKRTIKEKAMLQKRALDEA